MGSQRVQPQSMLCWPLCLPRPTGYHYSFPFLDDRFIAVEDNRVGPLYQHVFPPVAAPTLSFVGLPWKVSWVRGVELAAHAAGGNGQ